MSLAYEIVGAVFALLNLMSAYGKLARTEQFVDIMPTIGVPLRACRTGRLSDCRSSGIGDRHLVGASRYRGRSWFRRLLPWRTRRHLRKSDVKNLGGAC